MSSALADYRAPAVFWLTGISGAGKTTVAQQVMTLLDGYFESTIMLDGDQVRLGLNSDLGFDDDSRSESVRRLSEVAKLFLDKGFKVVVASISPLANHRLSARNCIGQDRFLEVHIHASIQLAIRRDPKSLYRRALAGEIQNVSGLDTVYEVPLDPKLKVNTEIVEVKDAAELIVGLLAPFIELKTSDSESSRGPTEGISIEKWLELTHAMQPETSISFSQG